MRTQLTRYFRFPFYVLNLPRRQEYVATDTIYANTPFIDCGHTRAQFYCGIDSQVCDVYGIKTDKQLINSFEYIIRQCRSMSRPISDEGQVETSGRVLDLLRTYVLGTGIMNHIINNKIIHKGNI